MPAWCAALVLVGDEELRHRPADRVGAREAEHRFGGGVEVEDDPLVVGQHEGVQGAADDLGADLLELTALRLARRQLLLLPHVVAQVAQMAHVELPSFDHHGGDGEFDRDDLACAVHGLAPDPLADDRGMDDPAKDLEVRLVCPAHARDRERG